MIQSMTGYGRASVSRRPFRLTVEIRSVNHRYFDYSAYLPPAFSSLDADIRKLVQDQLIRGRITVHASFSNESSLDEKLVLDERKLDFYVKTLRHIGRRYHLNGGVSLNSILTLPNLFKVEKKEIDGQYQKLLRATVSEALKKMILARQREGRSLAQDIVKRVKKITDVVTAVDRKAKLAPRDYKARLQKRLQTMADGVKADPERLAREVAMYAERADVTEEIVRAKHHLQSLVKCLHSSGERGKELDFILQELNREANTIASKAQDFDIAQHVVSVKSELEKIREQIQNVV